MRKRRYSTGVPPKLGESTSTLYFLVVSFMPNLRCFQDSCGEWHAETVVSSFRFPLGAVFQYLSTFYVIPQCVVGCIAPTIREENETCIILSNMAEHQCEVSCLDSCPNRTTSEEQGDHQLSSDQRDSVHSVRSLSSQI